jgi:hypothetical protein
MPRYEELYKCAFGAWGYNSGIYNWQLKAIAVRPECQRRGLGRAMMEVVQQKVMLSQNTPSTWKHATPRKQRKRKCGERVSLLPTSDFPVFPTSWPSEMTPNTLPFTIGCSQATATNHKVVVDCHSQIAVRTPLFVVNFQVQSNKLFFFYSMFRLHPSSFPPSVP